MNWFARMLAGSTLAMLAMAAPSGAQTLGSRLPEGQWHPDGGLKQIPLWPANLKIARPETDKPETGWYGNKLVGGKAYKAILDVTRPTMTIFPPKGRNTGAALLVFPGGGYEALAIDLEGTEICDWATATGMTCVVLKYRVPQDWHKVPGHEQAPKPQLALQDAQRAMGLIRARAGELGVDPHKVGVIGFSAGGHLATAVSNAETRTYAPVDAADRLPSRPDFAIVLYPGHLWTGGIPKDRVALAPWNTIHNPPPTFLLQSTDDPVDPVRNSVFYALALKDAGVPVELHLYPGAGHAFGLRKSDHPITSEWPGMAEKWLRGLGMLGR